MATTRQALMAILSRCDGAYQLDGQGFNRFDSRFAQEMAAKATWTYNQEQAIHSMLRKYQGQLAVTGIVYATLTFETPKAPDERPEARHQGDTPRANRSTGYVSPQPPFRFDYDANSQRFRIYSSFDWTEKAREIKQRAGGGFVKTPDARYWEYPATARFAEAVRPHLAGDLQMTPEANMAMIEILSKELKAQEEHQARNVLVKEIKVGVETLNVKLPVRYDRLINGKPFDHQVLAFHIAITLDHSAMLMEQGTGKSLVGVATSGYRHAQGQVKRVLIVAPTTVCGNWAEEYRKFADFPHHVAVLADTKKKRWEKKLIELSTVQGLQIIVLNYESLWDKEYEYEVDDDGNMVYYEGLGKKGVDPTKPFLDPDTMKALPLEEIPQAKNPRPKVVETKIILNRFLAGWAPDMVILDESQKIKNPQANAAKAAWKLGDQAKYRMKLTGTPVSQGPMDKFSQYRFTDSRVFGKNYFQMRQKYAVLGGWGGKKMIGYKIGEFLPNSTVRNPYYDAKASAEFIEKAHSIAFRVTKAEALDLPPTMDQELEVTMDPEQEKAYASMEEEMILTLSETERLTAPIVIAQMLRLQQITGGFIPRRDGTVLKVGNAKLAAVEEILEDAPEEKKFVIVCRFTPEVDAVAEVARKLGRKVLTLVGATKNRTDVIRQFQEDLETTVLVLQIQTGGVGITLTAADTMILYSETFSLNDYEQVKARIHRIGQRNACTYIHLVVPNSIDSEVLNALRGKGDMARLVVDILGKLKGGTSMTANLQEKLAEIKRQIETEAGNEVREDELPKNPDHLVVDFAKAQVEAQELPKQGTSTGRLKGDEKAQTSKTHTLKTERKPAIEGPVVTIKDLADEFKVEPKKLRKVLRKHASEKPGGRWEWAAGDPELEKIKAVLRKG